MFWGSFYSRYIKETFQKAWLAYCFGWEYLSLKFFGKSTPNQFKRLAGGKVAQISFYRGEYTETLLVPFVRRSSTRMLNSSIKVHYSDRVEELPHANGFPILVSPDDLEAQAITVINNHTEEEIYRATGATRPYYDFINY